MAKLVYKLNCISSGFDVGIVLSETEKMYNVVIVFKSGVYGCKWKWKKSECYDSIEASQSALNDRWKSKMDLAKIALEQTISNAKKHTAWNVEAKLFENEVLDYIAANGINVK